MGDLKLKTVNRGSDTHLKISGFLEASFEDYIAARVLLMNNLLIQGSILANTAIEKYFKAIIAFQGNATKRTHDIVGLLPSIKQFDKTLYDTLDLSFLKFLSKVYSMRYLDELKPGYNALFSKNHILSSLDDLYFGIGNKIRVENEDSIYRYHAGVGNPELLQDNYRLNSISLNEYLEQPDFIIEWRRLHNYLVVRFSYYSYTNEIEDIFEKDALIIENETDMHPAISFTPISQV